MNDYDMLRHFDLQIKVYYIHSGIISFARTMAAKRVAEELAHILGGTSCELPPSKTEIFAPELRVEFLVTCRRADLMLVSTRQVEVREFESLKIQDRKGWVDCAIKEELLHNLVYLLYDEFKKKLGWTDEN